MDKQFNLITIIEAVQKRFRAIVLISAVVLAGTFIITHPGLSILPPTYESISMFYPANLSLSDRPYLFDSQSAVDIEFDLFGNKQDVDRLVSIALSTQVIKHLVDKFNLVDHYKINRDKVEFPDAAAISKLKKNYKAFKNEYNSVEVHVFDENSQMAADVANELVAVTDKIYRQMVMDGRVRLMTALEKHTENKTEEVKVLSRQLDATTDAAEKKALEIKYDVATDQLVKYSKIIDEFKLVAADDISTIRIMERAYPSEKTVPYRWLIIGGAFFVTLFVLVIGASVIHVMTK